MLNRAVVMLGSALLVAGCGTGDLVSPEEGTSAAALTASPDGIDEGAGLIQSNGSNADAGASSRGVPNKAGAEEKRHYTVSLTNAVVTP
jgi:hypothetical protein